MVDLEKQILHYFLDNCGKDVPLKNLCDALGLKNKKDVNKILYSLEREGTLQKVHETPPVWRTTEKFSKKYNKQLKKIRFPEHTSPTVQAKSVAHKPKKKLVNEASALSPFNEKEEKITFDNKHYVTHFKELGILGSGAFGGVYKVWIVLFIKMELCESDIDEWPQNKRGDVITMTEEEVFYQLLLGVKYMHSKEIIHRDLKPTNIFVVNNGNKCSIKIGDFGLSRYLKEATDGSLTNCGPNYYAAPEQIKSTDYNKKVDIYSLGIIFLKILCQCKTISHLIKLKENFSEDKTMKEKFPQYISLIERMISINPEDRPDASQILNEYLFNILDIRKDIENLKSKISSLLSNWSRNESEFKKIAEIIIKANEELQKEISVLNEKLTETQGIYSH